MSEDERNVDERNRSAIANQARIHAISIYGGHSLGLLSEKLIHKESQAMTQSFKQPLSRIIRKGLNHGDTGDTEKKTYLTNLLIHSLQSAISSP